MVPPRGGLKCGASGTPRPCESTALLLLITHYALRIKTPYAPETSNACLNTRQAFGFLSFHLVGSLSSSL